MILPVMGAPSYKTSVVVSHGRLLKGGFALIRSHVIPGALTIITLSNKPNQFVADALTFSTFRVITSGVVF
jgi:hypothetical protein